MPNKNAYGHSNPTVYDGSGYHEKVWKTLSMSKKITIEVIDRYIDFAWNWEELSKRPDITIECIEKHKKKPWCWRQLSRNPNLTLEYILDNIHKDWNWWWLSINHLVGDKENWIVQKARTYIAARRIHRFWRDVCWNPEYSYAQKRLIQLFSES